MTLVSSIIKRAYRRSNLIAISATPSSNESTEALDALNGLIPSVLGNEAGSELSDLDIGGDNDMSSYVSQGAPDDCRLIVQQTAAQTILLDPLPYEGQQVAWVDVLANFATYNLTIDPNGRQIGGSSANLTLNTNSDNRRYLYRGDTANWVRISDLTTADQMPFPQEFDEFFITRLALILNPSHSAQMPQEAMLALERSEGQLRARYRKPRPRQDDGCLGLMGQSYGGGGSESAQFRRG